MRALTHPKFGNAVMEVLGFRAHFLGGMSVHERKRWLIVGEGWTDVGVGRSWIGWLAG
jgi:hypothetical protein